jgi:hypothetical protein
MRETNLTRLLSMLVAVVLVLPLTGCGPWIGAGVEIDPLPPAIVDPCPHPSDLVSRGGTVGDDEITVRRMGDALIVCGRKKQVAVGAFEQVRAALK